MITDIKTLYRSAWAFALACPLLFLVPVIMEMAQHVVELWAGMYVGEAGAKAAESDPLRLQFGFIKTLALLLPGYWFTRWIMFDGDARRAARVECPAVGLWSVVFAFGAGQMWWALYGPSLAGLVGLHGEAERYAGYGLTVAQQLLAFYLAAWGVAWALGNADVGPLKSVRIMRGAIFHAFVLWVAGMVPLMVLHYALAVVAVVWTPTAMDWALMIFDSIVVGYLALTLTGAGVLAARRAAAKRGFDLHGRAGPPVWEQPAAA